MLGRVDDSIMINTWCYEKLCIIYRNPIKNLWFYLRICQGLNGLDYSFGFVAF